MFLIKWYREWRQVRSDFYQPPICASCEALKETVNSLQYQNHQLLAALTRTPAPEVRPNIDNLKPVLPHRIPWQQRRQMLEAEDRHAATLLRKKQEEMNPQPPIASVAATTLEELEREVGVVREDDAREEERKTDTA